MSAQEKVALVAVGAPVSGARVTLSDEDGRVLVLELDKPGTLELARKLIAVAHGHAVADDK